MFHYVYRKKIIWWALLKKQKENKRTESREAGHISQWAEGRKMGAGGGKRRACHPPSAQRALLFFFFSSTLFFSPPASYFQPTVCACVPACMCVCVLEVRFGAEAIKALLKHFWCCWLMLKQKESEKKRGSETVREGAYTQWLSQPAQQSAGSLSILWAQRCEMSQQPNSNIKLSWAAEGKSRMERCGERCLLLTLSPSPDLHSSKPFKNPLKTPFTHSHTYSATIYTQEHPGLHF